MPPIIRGQMTQIIGFASLALIRSDLALALTRKLDFRCFLSQSHLKNNIFDFYHFPFSKGFHDASLLNDLIVGIQDLHECVTRIQSQKCGDIFFFSVIELVIIVSIVFRELNVLISIVLITTAATIISDIELVYVSRVRSNRLLIRKNCLLNFTSKKTWDLVLRHELLFCSSCRGNTAKEGNCIIKMDLKRGLLLHK